MKTGIISRLTIFIALVWWSVGHSQDSMTIKVPVGNVIYAKHAGVAQHPVMGGLDGPWQQFCPSGRDFGVGKYFADLTNRKMYYRDEQNVCRKIAGTGYVGPCLEGGADQTYFFFGLIGGYTGGGATDISDSPDETYINDTQKYRRLYLDTQGNWRINNWYGYGNSGYPAIGDTIAISALGSIDGNLRIDRKGEIGYMAPLGHGLCKLFMKENKITTLISFDSILAEAQVSFYQENMGDARIALDGKYYFTVNRSACMLRYDTSAHTLERYISGGANKGIRGYDGTWRLDAGFFATAFKIPLDPTVIFSGGGDEGYLRRIYQDTVKHLMSDASWQRVNERGVCFNVPRMVEETSTGNLIVSTGEHGVGYSKLAYYFDAYKETRIPVSSTSVKNMKISDFPIELSALPNPFNPSVKIRINGFNMFKAGSLNELAVYDIKGHKIADLSNGFVQNRTGAAEVTWNASGYPSGVYLVRVKIGNKLLVDKVTLSK